MPSARRWRLLGLIGSESLRTFNDNVLRVVVILLLIGRHDAEQDVQRATAAVHVAYTVPWILLSLLAGHFADRLSKGRVLRGLKLAEVAVMLLAAVALQVGAPRALLVVVVLVGTLTALASPAKYGILPELLPSARLAWGNGRLLLGTYVAIISGTALGGILLDFLRPWPWAIGVILAVLALVGYAFARRVPAVPAQRAGGGLRETAHEGWSVIRNDPRLRLAMVGSVLYWALAALVSQDLIVYAKTVLGLSDTGKGLLLSAVAVGIGCGGLLAGVASRGRIALGQLLLGATLMALAASAFGLLEPTFAPALLLLFALGIGAGFFLVPLSALIQDQAPATLRGAVLAIMNVVAFVGVVLGSVTAWLLAEVGLSSAQILLTAALFLAVLVVYGAAQVPRWLRQSEGDAPVR